MADVEVTGLTEVLNKLDEKFSPGKVARIENQALQIGGRLVAVNLKNAVAGYQDTGATLHEIVVGKSRLKAGVRTADVGWDGQGSKQRWRLVHLNEWGYTRYGKSYHPRGMGKIQQSFDESKEPAMRLQIKELKKLL